MTSCMVTCSTYIQTYTKRRIGHHLFLYKSCFKFRFGKQAIIHALIRQLSWAWPSHILAGVSKRPQALHRCESTALYRGKNFLTVSMLFICCMSSYSGQKMMAHMAATEAHSLNANGR